MSKMKEKIGNLLLELDVNSHQATILKFISDADELIIPEKVVHERQLFHITTIEKDSFVNCKLKKIFFPYSIQNLKEGWCNLIKNVNSIIVSPQNPILLNLDNKLLLSKSNLISNNYENILFAKKNIECIVIPSFIKKISSFCFSFCLKLKKLNSLSLQKLFQLMISLFLIHQFKILFYQILYSLLELGGIKIRQN